jgi:hypothetical protein
LCWCVIKMLLPPVGGAPMLYTASLHLASAAPRNISSFILYFCPCCGVLSAPSTQLTPRHDPTVVSAFYIPLITAATASAAAVAAYDDPGDRRDGGPGLRWPWALALGVLLWPWAYCCRLQCWRAVTCAIPSTRHPFLRAYHQYWYRYCVLRTRDAWSGAASIACKQ